MDDLLRIVQLLVAAILGGLVAHALTYVRERGKRRLERLEKLMRAIAQTDLQVRLILADAIDRIDKNETVREDKYLRDQLFHMEAAAAHPAMKGQEAALSVIQQSIFDAKVKLQKLTDLPKSIDLEGPLNLLNGYKIELDAAYADLPWAIATSSSFTEAIGRATNHVEDVRRKLKAGYLTEYQREKWTTVLSHSIDEVAHSANSVIDGLRAKARRESENWRATTSG
jgi:hypothetical protein